jgi:hypothetical protein
MRSAAPRSKNRDPRHKQDFGGKFRNDCLAKTSPAGWPKSDCEPRRPEKYGTNMAAIVAFRPHAWNSVTEIFCATGAIVRKQKRKLHDVENGTPRGARAYIRLFIRQPA